MNRVQIMETLIQQLALSFQRDDQITLSLKVCCSFHPSLCVAKSVSKKNYCSLENDSKLPLNRECVLCVKVPKALLIPIASDLVLLSADVLSMYMSENVKVGSITLIL